MQGMLDLMGTPTCIQGLATSVIAIDKQSTKNELVPRGHSHAGRRDRRIRESLYAAGIRRRALMC